jgi:hypothetical protein
MGNQSPTPGPWHVKWDKYSVYIRASAPTKDISICKVMTHRNHNNLNILTYAPDMLAVLQYAESVLNMAATNTHAYDGKQLEASLADLSAEIGNVLNKIGETNA